MLSLNANDLALADLGYTGVQVMQALVSLGSSIKICLCRWLICVLVLVSTRQSWISAAVWPHVWHGYMVWLHGMACCHEAAARHSDTPPCHWREAMCGVGLGGYTCSKPCVKPCVTSAFWTMCLVCRHIIRGATDTGFAAGVLPPQP